MKRNVLLIVLFGLFVGSCCTEKSAVRYLENNPEVLEKMEKDTIIVVETPAVDTIVVARADTVSLVDTFFIDSIRLIVRKDTVNGIDTFEIQRPPEIVEVEVPVTEYVIKKRVVPIPAWKQTLMWMGGLFVLLILGGLIYFIRLLFK